MTTHNITTLNTVVWTDSWDCNGNLSLSIPSSGENTGYVEHTMDVITGVDYLISPPTIQGCSEYKKIKFTNMSSYTSDGIISIRLEDNETAIGYGGMRLIDIYVRCSISDVYNWYSVPSGFTSSNQNIIVSPTENTQYIASYTYGGCTAYDTVNIDVINFDLGSDIEVCEGETVTLYAGDGPGFMWNTGETAQQISPTVSGNYSVTVSGCSQSDDVNVTFNPLPIVDLGATQRVCDGDIITLDAGSFNQYEWSTGETSQTIDIVDNSGNFLVTVTDANNCSNSANVDVFWYSYPVTDLGAEQTICGGNSINLVGEDSFSNFDYIWSTSETTTTITVSTPNTYSVTITNKNANCQIIEEVIVNEGGNLELGSDIEFCGSNPQIIDAGIADAYEWNTGSINSTISPTTSGNYTVTITDACGTMIDNINVTVNTNPTPEIIPIGKQNTL